VGDLSIYVYFIYLNVFLYIVIRPLKSDSIPVRGNGYEPGSYLEPM
jgi:hypothetical protein